MQLGTSADRHTLWPSLLSMFQSERPVANIRNTRQLFSPLTVRFRVSTNGSEKPQFGFRPILTSTQPFLAVGDMLVKMIDVLLLTFSYKYLVGIHANASMLQII